MIKVDKGHVTISGSEPHIMSEITCLFAALLEDGDFEIDKEDILHALDLSLMDEDELEKEMIRNIGRLLNELKGELDGKEIS